MKDELDRGEFIQGWMSRAELEWLYAQAALASRICEVGCHMGRSTWALCRGTTGRVWAVDSWEDPKAYEVFSSNMSGARNLIRMKGESVPTARILKVLFDLVFIDADHAYEAVAADIKAWLPKVSRGGILAGHDYDGGWPGVVQAVNELIGFKMKRWPGSIWYMVR